MAADRPAAPPPDNMKVRGRLRVVWLALWLAGAAALVLDGVYGYIPGETPEPHRQYLSVSLFVAALLVVIGVRTVGRGFDADGNGVVVRKTLRATPTPWRELAAIEFKGDSEVWNISGWYYKLVFQRHDGSRVTAEAPAGRGTGPGEYLFELRERLLAMRSAALGDPHAPADRPSDAASTDASSPTTPPDTPPTTSSWPLLDTPPTSATISDAAGKAVPAGVAAQAPSEPFVPGSGDRIPAQLRLVLAGYAGIACGLFAGALACAAAFVLVFVDADIRLCCL